jgi:hypothetical protein
MYFNCFWTFLVRHLRATSSMCTGTVSTGWRPSYKYDQVVYRWRIGWILVFYIYSIFIRGLSMFLTESHISPSPSENDSPPLYGIIYRYLVDALFFSQTLSIFSYRFISLPLTCSAFSSFPFFIFPPVKWHLSLCAPPPPHLGEGDVFSNIQISAFLDVQMHEDHGPFFLYCILGSSFPGFYSIRVGADCY